MSEYDRFGFRYDLKQPRIPMKNRDRWGIIKRFLATIKDENKTRTRIMYECMLSNDQMKECINFLEIHGCIEIPDYVTSNLTKYGSRGAYRLTKKGMRISQLLDGMHNSLPFIDETRKP